MRGAAASVIPNLDAVIRMIRRTGKVARQGAFQTNGLHIKQMLIVCHH